MPFSGQEWERWSKLIVLKASAETKSSAGIQTQVGKSSGGREADSGFGHINGSFVLIASVMAPQLL